MYIIIGFWNSTNAHTSNEPKCDDSRIDVRSPIEEQLLNGSLSL